jgi:hypothetical protein
MTLNVIAMAPPFTFYQARVDATKGRRARDLSAM